MPCTGLRTWALLLLAPILAIRAGTGKSFTDAVTISSLPYTSPTMNLADGTDGFSTDVGETCGFNLDWIFYRKQVFAFKETKARTVEFRDCDSSTGTVDFQHMFWVLDCAAQLTWADGKGATECSFTAPASNCGAYGKKYVLSTKVGHWYYLVVVGYSYIATQIPAKMYLVSVEDITPPPSPPPYKGDYVTNPWTISALPFTTPNMETIAQGPYGLPGAIGKRTAYKYDENTPLRKRIFAYAETASRYLTVKTCVTGSLPNFNHLIWVVECPHKLTDKDAMDSADCTIFIGASCVGTSADWYSMKKSLVTTPGYWYYFLVMAVNTQESDSTSSTYKLSVTSAAAPPSPPPPPAVQLPPSPPPPPPPKPGKTFIDPVLIPSLPYTSPSMSMADGGVGLSTVVGELCRYNIDWLWYTKQVFAFKETTTRYVEFRTCDSNADTTSFQHVLFTLDCPTKLTFADGTDAGKCACIDPLACGGIGLTAALPTKAGRWYYAIMVTPTAVANTIPPNKYLLSAQAKTAPPATTYLGDKVTSPIKISSLAYLSPQLTIAERLGTYGIPDVVGGRTPYKYNQITPLRKRIFVYTETAKAARTLTFKTCVPGSLPNFNHLIWLLTCPRQLLDSKAMDSADCTITVGSSCVGTAADWYSMKVVTSTVPGYWYYIWVLAVNTGESNDPNNKYNLQVTPSGPVNMTNRACFQSSTLSGRSATAAVDGKATTYSATASTSSTPWWAAPLDTTGWEVKSVSITLRTDSAYKLDSMHDVSIWVGNVKPTATQHPSAVLTECASQTGQLGTATGQVVTLSCTTALVGKYMAISIRGVAGRNEVLSMTEVAIN